MSDADLIVALVLIAGVLAAIGVGVSGVAGVVVGPPTDDATTTTPMTTGTVSGPGTASDQSLFSLTVVGAASCGLTCRDVTIELTNNRARSVTNVVLVARVFAGRTTEADAIVWRGRTRIGTMTAQGTTIVSRQIGLSLAEGNAVRKQNGWVTVVVTIDSDAGSATITRELQVL
ncbi:MAG: hypothetical protein ABEJ48_10660 [Halobacteriales archaeon]